MTHTRDGQGVAVTTVPDGAAGRGSLHGSLRDRTVIPEGLDLTAPVLDELLDAERGILHR